MATIIAVAVNTEGRCEVLVMATGPSEAEPFWTAFLRRLMHRGLRGVKLVISQAHEGLNAAAAKLVATALLGRFLDDFVQLHGGYGAEYGVGRAWVDARVSRIAGGASEALKDVAPGSGISVITDARSGGLGTARVAQTRREPATAPVAVAGKNSTP